MSRLITVTVTLHFLATSHAMPTALGLTLPELPIFVDSIDKAVYPSYRKATESSSPLPEVGSRYLGTGRLLSMLLERESLPMKTPEELPETMQSPPIVSKRGNLSINQELKTLARMLVSRDSRRRRNKAEAVRSRLISLGKRSGRATGSRAYVYSEAPIGDTTFYRLR